MSTYYYLCDGKVEIFDEQNFLEIYKKNQKKEFIIIKKSSVNFCGDDIWFGKNITNIENINNIIKTDNLRTFRNSTEWAVKKGYCYQF